MIDNDGPLLFTVGVALAALVLVMLVLALRSRRRKRDMARPFPPEWRALLSDKVVLYARIPPDLALQLEPLVRAFLADVEFVGCQGLAITDEMRLVISVQACLLIANHGPGAYDALRSVLVYPDEFVVEESSEDEAGVVTEGSRVLSGQTFETARIILSWRDVQESGTAEAPYNVVLHEFAHYLDHSVGGALTAPDQVAREPGSWHEVLETEYEALCDAVDRGEPTLIDPYGAEHLEEFFAVATEAFFEASRELRTHHPHLYEQLRAFYRLDPASWT